MSGGSMDYLYLKIQDASFREHTPERRAFAKHLQLVAEALHDIEWVDSCDYGQGDESAAIRKCLAPGAILEAAIADAEKARQALAAEIERATAGKTASTGETK